MDQQSFNAWIQAIVERIENNHLRDALEKSQQLKQYVISEHLPFPEQVGLSRFYEFKCLYALEQYKNALDLLKTPETVNVIVNVKQKAWMNFIGAEISLKLGLTDDIVFFGKECIQIHLENNDMPSALVCANKVCSYLAQLEKDILNTDFALFLIDNGDRENDFPAVLNGYAWLLDNITFSNNPALIMRIVSDYDHLNEISETVDSEDLYDILDRIENAEWFNKGKEKKKPIKLDLGL